MRTKGQRNRNRNGLGVRELAARCPAFRRMRSSVSKAYGEYSKDLKYVEGRSKSLEGSWCRSAVGISKNRRLSERISKQVVEESKSVVIKSEDRRRESKRSVGVVVVESKCSRVIEHNRGSREKLRRTRLKSSELRGTLCGI